jgi:hypothetical protein
MLLVLLLKVYHRKEYRETESFLNNNPHLLKELGPKKAPGKSTIQRAAARIGIDTLVKVNDTITARFKKARSCEKEERSNRLVGPGDKEEHLVHDKDARQPVQEERLQEAPHSLRMRREGEADLLLDSDIRTQARLPKVQDTPEEGPRKYRDRLRRQGELVQGER